MQWKVARSAPNSSGSLIEMYQSKMPSERGLYPIVMMLSICSTTDESEDHRMLVRKQESTMASKLKVDVTQSTKQVSVAPRKVYDVLELWF